MQTHSCCISTLLSPRKSGGSSRTEPDALAARKAQGMRLGNRSNAVEAAASGRNVEVEEAAAFANVLSTIESLRASGVRDLRRDPPWRSAQTTNLVP